MNINIEGNGHNNKSLELTHNENVVRTHIGDDLGIVGDSAVRAGIFDQKITKLKINNFGWPDPSRHHELVIINDSRVPGNNCDRTVGDAINDLLENTIAILGCELNKINLITRIDSENARADVKYTGALFQGTRGITSGTIDLTVKNDIHN